MLSCLNRLHRISILALLLSLIGIPLPAFAQADSPFVSVTAPDAGYSGFHRGLDETRTQQNARAHSKAASDGKASADSQPPQFYPPIWYKTLPAGYVRPMTGNVPPYYPAYIRSAYGLNSLTLSNTTGAGITVAIVDQSGDLDSNGNDLIQGDLQTFCTNTGLAYNGPTSGSPTLTEAFPDGAPTASSYNPNWAVETALDVEWVHAIAPGAHILLIAIPTTNSLLDGVTYANTHAPIVSMSWGFQGGFGGENAWDTTYFSAPNVCYFAGSGDWGAMGFYPAESPNVTAVGGTTLNINASGNWLSETAWSGSGGGVSEYEPYALFQSPWVSSGNRAFPDVSAIADPQTGVYVQQGGFQEQVGGTSLATPIWAAFTAIIDANLAQPLGETALHNFLYLYGNPTNLNSYFHDIVAGDNGYPAGPGYDYVTGIGSPMGNVLFSAIVNTPAPTSAPSITSALTASGNQGTAFSYQIVATNSPTSYNATGLPSGLTINTVTGLISGNPANQGTTNVSISATNAAGPTTVTLAVTVNAPLPAPVITSASSVTAPAQTNFLFQVTATNSPNYYTAINLPAGLTCDYYTGRITGMPYNTGVSTFTLQATNFTGTGSQQFTLTVNPPAPVIDGATQGWGSLNTPYSFQIMASNNPTSYNAVGLPTGLTVNQATGLISGTPTATGTFQVTLDATNISGTCAYAFTLTIGSTAPGTITVTNLNDSGTGSLRAAITSANSAPGSTIDLSGLTGTILLASSLPNIAVDTTIKGPGSGSLTLNTSGSFGSLDQSGGTTKITGLTLENQQPNGYTFGNNPGSTSILSNCVVGPTNGNGIGISGNAIVTNCTFTRCANIGIINFGGIVTVDNSSFTNNSGTGIENDDWLTISHSNLSNNFGVAGGGIGSYEIVSWTTGAIIGFATADVTDCTFYGNTTDDLGGGIVSGGNATITNCTFISNTANEYQGAGGGLWIGPITGTLTNDIFFGNTTQGVESEIVGPTNTNYSDVDGGYTGTGNININPLVAALGNYGGSTQTMALLPGSPCLGAGTNAGLTVDQRGIALPQGGRYDIGAFESQGFTVSATSGNNQSTETSTAFPNPLVATVTSNVGYEPVAGGLLTFTAPATGASAALTGSPATIGAGGAASVTAQANGTLGSYSVTANTTAATNASFQLANTNTPGAPTNLKAAGGNSQVVLTWTASAGATSYNVYEGSSAGGENATPIASVTTGSTYTVPGLTNGTAYFFEVTAVNSFGESGRSNEASATPNIPATAAFVKSDTTTSGTWKGVYGSDGYNVINDTSATEPNYPAYATVSATGNTPFTWTASTTNAPALQWAASGSTNRIAACWYAATSETIDLSLTDGLTHQVALYLLDYDNSSRTDAVSIADAGSGTVLNSQSVANFKNGAYEVWKISGHVKITITKSGFANAVVSGIFFDSPPAAPINLTATGGNAQVALSWTASTGAASYNVYRGTTAGGEAATAIKTGLTTASYTDTTVTNGTTYYYKVTAVSAIGEGAKSNEASATPQVAISAPPTGLSATNGITQSVLTWTASTGATSYNVYEGATSGGETLLQSGVSGTTYTATGLTNGTTYYFEVTAVDIAGESGKSNEASATPATGPTATVTFVKSDTTTSGTWKGVYGHDGYNIINDTSAAEPNYPAYATVSATGNTPFTWAASTTNAPALQWAASGSTNRIAACWYAATSETIDLNLTDGQTHQFALYLLDWDNSGRTDGVSITDAGTGTVLNTQSVASFKNGVYEVWNIKGHVKITLTKSGFANAVVSGLFFDAAPAPPAAPTNLNATGGNAQVALTWTASAGATSYNVYRGTTANGEGATAVKTGLTTTTYTDTTVTNGTTYYYEVTAVNAVGEGAKSNEASATPLISVPAPPAGLTAAPGNAQAILNWTASTGATSYNVYEGTTSGGENSTPVGSVTGTTYTATGLTNGTKYYFTVAAVNTAGSSSPSNEASATPSSTSTPATATFVKSDTTTSGTWKGVYGADGYNVIADTSATEPNYPAYAAVSPTGNNPHTWAASTTNTQALQWAATGSTNRIAACWYAATTQTINVNLTDGKIHQIALYLLDYDNSGRAQKITISDAGPAGTVLNTQTVSGFSKGIYDVWQISGNVNITLSTTGGPNNVISGLFFDTTPPPAAPTNLTAAAGSAQATLSWTASSGAASYNVYEGTTAGGEGSTPVSTGLTGTTATITGLTNGSKYYFTVAAVNAVGTSGPSNEASVTLPTATVSFVKADTSTSGTWKGVYGADGYNIINDTSATEPNYPAYATVSATGNTQFTWAASTTNTPALQWAAAGSTNRIAACWYAATSQSIDVNLTDGQTHQVALYLLDYDNSGRAESVAIADAATGAVLNTQSVATFKNGVYEVWNINGHVKITLTKTGAANAAVSGIFFK